MVLEGSTGFSGAFGRGLTVNQNTASTPQTADMLDALELSSGEGAIVLQGEGVFISDTTVTPIELQFDARFESGVYLERTDDNPRRFSRNELLSQAESGEFVGTFTARIGEKVDVNNPQPAVWTQGSIQTQRGRQQFPVLSAGNIEMLISGRHIQNGAAIYVDGRKVSGSVGCQGGALPACDDEVVIVELDRLPVTTGLHFLQIQNPEGLFSNDFIFHTQ